MKYPNIYAICRKIYKTNLADAFSVSVMVSYYIEHKKYDEGLRYIKELNLEEDGRNKLQRAFKSYEKAC